MNDKAGINYLISGPSHLPNLVVSLYSLRAVGLWTGPIFVHAWPESFGIIEQIARDERLSIEVFEREPAYRGKNSQFLDKIQVMQECPTKVGMYLDADTIACRTFDELIYEAELYGFCATQFNDWTTQIGTVKRRIERLVEREPINQESVQIALTQRLSSVNGGVFACRHDSIVLPTWYDWTYAVKDIFIADETVLHACMVEYDSTGSFSVLHGGSWNCSPKYMPRHAQDKQVRIWHFHGDSNLRPSKSQKGFDLWWPRYQQCLNMNIGNILDWKDDCRNKYLPLLEREHDNEATSVATSRR